MAAVRDKTKPSCLACGAVRPDQPGEEWEHFPDCPRLAEQRCSECGVGSHLPHLWGCPHSRFGGHPSTTTGKIESDGGSSTYYFLPKDATELNDLIEYREMSFARGNIFKALYRLGEKAGIDVDYDLNKIQLFLNRLRAMNKAGRKL